MCLIASLLFGGTGVETHAASAPLLSDGNAPENDHSATDIGESLKPAFSPFVSVKGRALIAPDGQPLRIKGINLANWLVPEGYLFDFEGARSARAITMILNQLMGDLETRRFWRRFRDSYVTRDDIQFIKDSGFNAVRIPFSYRLFVGSGLPPALEGVGYRLLDQVIGWCREAGLYAILDLHAAPGGQTGSVMDDSWGYPYVYEDAASQDLTVRLWRALAERYKGETAVLGYDLLNEPIADYLNVAALNPKLEPLFKRITAAIREVDPNHLIIIEGTRWGSDFSVFGPPFDDKLVYSFHKYWVEPTPDAIQPYIEFRNKYDVPLFMGESGEASNAWIKAMRVLLERHDIGWAFWPYKGLDTSAAVVSVSPSAEWEAISTFAARPVATIEHVRAQRPARVVIAKAVETYLNNIKFEHCRVNSEYLTALGLMQVVADVGLEQRARPLVAPQ
ncbi:MAG: glycoside hydrolase family 5 protein [Rhodospirillales bacterium]|nr:glycoside hydrolase family 5 protein [Rhodospirillales bacterium]